MFRLVEAGLRRPGALRPDRTARLLAGRGGVRLAGASAGSRASSCTRFASSASTRSSRGRSSSWGDGPVFLTVDVDVLDPAFAPGTGTPEPGGMSYGDLLGPAGRSRPALDLVGADVVEVHPDRGRLGRHHRAVADRIVREITDRHRAATQLELDQAAATSSAVWLHSSSRSSESSDANRSATRTTSPPSVFSWSSIAGSWIWPARRRRARPRRSAPHTARPNPEGPAPRTPSC